MNDNIILKNSFLGYSFGKLRVIISVEQKFSPEIIVANTQHWIWANHCSWCITYIDKLISVVSTAFSNGWQRKKQGSKGLSNTHYPKYIPGQWQINFRIVQLLIAAVCFLRNWYNFFFSHHYDELAFNMG